eukprot:UN00626
MDGNGFGRGSGVDTCTDEIMTNECTVDLDGREGEYWSPDVTILTFAIATENTDGHINAWNTLSVLIFGIGLCIMCVLYRRNKTTELMMLDETFLNKNETAKTNYVQMDV